MNEKPELPPGFEYRQPIEFREAEIYCTVSEELVAWVDDDLPRACTDITRDPVTKEKFPRKRWVELFDTNEDAWNAVVARIWLGVWE